MDKFIVRNTRPLRTVTLYGRVLAPASVGGRTNTMVLSLAELLGGPCVDLFKAERLALVGRAMPEELVAAIGGISGDGLSIAEPAAAEPPSSSPEPVVVEPQVPAAPVEVESPSTSTPPEDSAPAATELHTESELLELKASQLRELAENLGLDSSGTKAEITKRILDSEAGVS